MIGKVILAATLVVSAFAKTAQMTWYQSYPMCCYDKNAPYQDECTKYNGCKWAGMFANGEKLSLKEVQDTPIVSFFDVNNKSQSAWEKKYKNKKIRVTKGDKTFTAYIKDTCSDKDTQNNDCTRNSKGGYLIDVEYFTAKKYLGSTNKASGSV